MPHSRRSSQCRDQTPVSCIAGGFFTVWATIKVTKLSKVCLPWYAGKEREHVLIELALALPFVSHTGCLSPDITDRLYLLAGLEEPSPPCSPTLRKCWRERSGVSTWAGSACSGWSVASTPRPWPGPSSRTTVRGWSCPSRPVPVFYFSFICILFLSH